MKGPRLFALVVLLALALLPKTGWIVRNQIDVLKGGWGRFGIDLGLSQPFGSVPYTLFRDALDDPEARLLATPSADPGAKAPIIDRAQPLLGDPASRERIRASVVRQSFRLLYPSAFEGERRTETVRIARRTLDLIQDGERTEPRNAFYPSCEWAIRSLLDDDPSADAALRRAAECEYYEDDAIAEGRIVARGVERRVGYRGSAVRLVALFDVLLPQYTALLKAANGIAETTSLDDPRRRDVLRLGRILARTSPETIGVFVGASLIRRGVGVPARLDGSVFDPERFDLFARRNAGFDLSSYRRIVERTSGTEWPDINPIRNALQNSATLLGAGLLLAIVLFLGAGLPWREEPDETFEARIRRAPWAWLAATPALLHPGAEVGPYGLFIYPLALLALLLLWRMRSVRPGTVALGMTALATLGAGFAQPLWWVALPLAATAVWLPTRFRSVALTLVTLGAAAYVADIATRAGGYGGFGWALGLTIFSVIALRAVMPVRAGLGVPPAIVAGLYLVSVAFVLRADAGQAAILRSWEDAGRRFRMERGI